MGITAERIQEFFCEENHLLLIAKIRVLRNRTEAIRPVVEGYKTEILKGFEIVYDCDIDRELGAPEYGTQVLDPEDLYRVDSKGPQEEKVQAYYQALQRAHVENGFGEMDGKCPLLCAESDVRDAERLLREAFAIHCDEPALGRWHHERTPKLMEMLTNPPGFDEELDELGEHVF